MVATHRLTAAQQTLVESNRPLVKWCLARIRTPQGIDPDDVLSAGYVGLVIAGQRFDPLRGVAFGTYAVLCIRSAVFSEIRSWRRHQRLLRFVGWIDTPSRAGGVDEGVASADAARWLLKGLKRRERTILDDWMKGHSGAMIGRRNRLSRQHANQLVRDTLASIRERKGIA